MYVMEIKVFVVYQEFNISKQAQPYKSHLLLPINYGNFVGDSKCLAVWLLMNYTDLVNVW